MNEEDLVLEVTSEEVTEAEETDKEESFGSEVKTPQPAPRRSSRLRSKAHLDKDFVYNFGQSSHAQGDVERKVNFLKQVVQLF